jgi:thiol:disulfide interchange protein DsbD
MQCDQTLSKIGCMMGFEETLAQGSAWALLSVFIAGVATSLTPCVYPMIPITVSIFGAKEARSRLSAFLLAVMYVQGIAVMYTALGIAAALSGKAAGALLASPWFVVPLAIFFVVMATSMFGLWEIRLPFWLQNRMSSVGGKGYRGAFMMGLVGGILIAPCTGPVLASLLLHVATTGNIAMGALLLYTYALGIGVLFLLIATFALALPKSGAWMDVVKSVFGVALLVGALYYLAPVISALSRFTSSEWWFAATMGGGVVVGVLIGGLHLSYHGALAQKIRKTVGIALISASLFGLVNYALTPSTKLPWVYDEPKALAMAKAKQRPVLVDFSAKWCVPCREMEAKVLTDPAVLRELSGWVLLKIDVTKDTERDRALQKKYKAPELPQLVMLDGEGNEKARSGKITNPDKLLELLRKAK